MPSTTAHLLCLGCRQHAFCHLGNCSVGRFGLRVRQRLRCQAANGLEYVVVSPVRVFHRLSVFSCVLFHCLPVFLNHSTDDICGLLDICSEQQIRSIADGIVAQGMDKLGYQWVTLDGALSCVAFKFSHGRSLIASW